MFQVAIDLFIILVETMWFLRVISMNNYDKLSLEVNESLVSSERVNMN